MEGEEEHGGNGRGSRGKEELETILLDKVGAVSSAVGVARHVDDVVCALHSLAVLLFPVDSTLVAGPNPFYSAHIGLFSVSLSSLRSGSSLFSALRITCSCLGLQAALTNAAGARYWSWVRQGC